MISTLIAISALIVVGALRKWLSFRKKKREKISKLQTEASRAKTVEIFEEYFHRLPGFPQGIPVIPLEFLIQKNQALIKDIIVARGLSGRHNKAEAEAKIWSPIRHLAEMTHLLPASEESHFKLPGGLFAFCLEVSLFSIRHAEQRILTRATPEIRKDEESLWTHAAFLNGLFSEAITAISRLSVYSEEVGIEWHPGTELLFEWLQRNNLKSYHIRWSPKEDRSVIYMLAGKAVDSQQAEILVEGEKAVLSTLLGALNDKTNFNNPLAKINETLRYKIMERDVWTRADFYGKPLAGMHLEPWFVDAMRHLVQNSRWVANTTNGRVWHGQDGLFLVWPLAAGDMQYQLRVNECPFIPSTKEILADIMLDAGIIQRNNAGGYLFDIGIPVAESAEKKHLEALKFARYETLFVKTISEPIDGSLEIELDEDEDPEDDAAEGQAVEVKSLPKPKNNSQGREAVPDGPNETQDRVIVSRSVDADNQALGSSMDETEANDQPIDIALLFGKKADLAAEHGKPTGNQREEDPVLIALVWEESVASAASEYGDDYAADYDREEMIYGEGFALMTLGAPYDAPADPVLVEEKTNARESNKNTREARTTETPSQAARPEANAPKKKAVGKEPNSQPEDIIAKPAKSKPKGASAPASDNEELFAELLGSSKTKQKTGEAGNKTKAESADVNALFGKAKTTGSADQTVRAKLVLERLGKLPAQYLETQPDGTTKVVAIGLKNTKMELRDCVSVLKEASMLVLINGVETALDESGKPRSRYFLVKADLINGK